MTTNDPEIEARLELAKRISVEAGKLTLQYFRTDQFEVEYKQDGTPLTIADREAEKLLRKEIESAFPDDAIIGEEFGETAGTSGFQWALDPIDGTKSFIKGVPLYATMVGVLQGDMSKVGAIYFPGLNEGAFAATDSGCWSFVGDNPPRRAHVSQRTELKECVLVTSAVETFQKCGAESAYRQLSDKVYFCRTWGDAYGYLLVATGRVDIMIDPILCVWDAAAVQPIIDEAGGKFSDWSGARSVVAGNSIGSNGRVHDEILEVLSKFKNEKTVSKAN